MFRSKTKSKFLDEYQKKKKKKWCRSFIENDNVLETLGICETKSAIKFNGRYRVPSLYPQRLGPLPFLRPKSHLLTQLKQCFTRNLAWFHSTRQLYSQFMTHETLKRLWGHKASLRPTNLLLSSLLQLCCILLAKSDQQQLGPTCTI